MTNEIIIAGFGGQGALLIGEMIAHAGMNEGKNVSWLPSYGPEMRGGTANCSVIISNEPVGSPIVTEADAAIVMNKPSLDKFESYLKPGGKLFINSSLIEKKASRTDITVYYIPANEIAASLGNTRVANMVMLGAYIASSQTVSKENIMELITEAFGAKKAHLVAVNEKALDEGATHI